MAEDTRVWDIVRKTSVELNEMDIVRPGCLKHDYAELADMGLASISIWPAAKAEKLTVNTNEQEIGKT